MTNADQLSWLIFSDTHLTPTFDQEKYDFLIEHINKADRVIINGDFIDCLMADPKEVLRSQWQPLFRQLLEKDAIFLYGNHDPESLLSPSQTAQFSAVQGRWWRFQSGAVECLVTHGHMISPTQEALFTNEKMVRRVAAVGRWLQHSSLKWYPTELLYRLLWSGRINSRLSRWARQQLHASQLLICGHSHGQQHRPERQYVNAGAVDEGRAELVKITSGEVQLVSRRS